MTETRSQVLAIIPVREKDSGRTEGMPLLGGRSLIAHTVDAAKRARTISRIVVTTDSEAIRQLAIELGAEAPFLRPVELASDGTTLEQVLQQCLAWLEKNENYHPDIVVRLEISHPLRSEHLIDEVVQTLQAQKLDTVFTAYEEHHHFWRVNQSGELELMTDARETRTKRLPIYKEMSGLVCAMKSDVIRSGQRMGYRVGVVPLTSLQALVDTQDAHGLDLARRLLEESAP